MLLTLIGWGIAVLLVGVLAALVTGHADSGPKNLDLFRHYISEYGNASPNWPWIMLATYLFAGLLMLLAAGFLLATDGSQVAGLGCLLLSASSMALYFVGYTPVHRVEVAPAASAALPWGPETWILQGDDRSLREQGMADAYDNVHIHAVRLVLLTCLGGFLLVALGALRLPAWRGFSRTTFPAAGLMAALFLLGEDESREWRGLWQRLGFLVMYVWLWFARHAIVSAPRRFRGTPAALKR